MDEIEANATWGYQATSRTLHIRLKLPERHQRVWVEFAAWSQWCEDPTPWECKAPGVWNERLAWWAFNVDVPGDRWKLSKQHAQQIDAKFFTKKGLLRRRVELHRALIQDHFQDVMQGGCMPVPLDRLLSDRDTARWVIGVIGADALRLWFDGGPRPRSDAPEAARAFNLLDRYVRHYKPMPVFQEELARWDRDPEQDEDSL